MGTVWRDIDEGGAESKVKGATMKREMVEGKKANLRVKRKGMKR